MNTTKKLSEDILEYQPDAVEIEERMVPGKIRWVLYLILGSLIAAVVGAIIFQVDRIVVAEGELITTLRNVPDGFRLMPGMKVRAEIKVGRRSVISYFLYPIIRAFDESLREP